LGKKAHNVRLLEVKGLSSLTDYLLIASGRSDRQVQAIAEGVRLGLKQEHATAPLAVEGMNEGRWVLIDYGDVMVHVFQEPVREFYDLDGLWSEAAEVAIPEKYHWERSAAAR
jgi:ribosome-associated protein